MLGRDLIARPAMRETLGGDQVEEEEELKHTIHSTKRL